MDLHASKLTIRREFFLVGLSMLMVITLVFTAFQSVGIYQTGMDSALERISGANRQISAYLEAHLEGLSASVRIMAASPEVIFGDDETADAQSRALAFFRFIEEVNPNVEYCYAGYADGSLLINDYETPPGYDSTVRPWYTAALESMPGLNIGLPYQDIKSHEWLISVSEALLDGSKVRGVVAVDSDIPSLDGMLNRIKAFPSQTNFVVDGKGVILVHQDPDLLGRNFEDISPGSMDSLRENFGYIDYAMPDAGSRRGYYTKLGITDWFIISSIEKSEICAPILSKIMATVSLMILLSIVLGILQTRIHESRFVKPLSILKDRVAAITEGLPTETLNYTITNQELASIAKNIEAMTESSLTRKAYELNLIIESASDGILVVAVDWRVIHRNRRFLDIWNLPAGLDVDDSFDRETRALMSRGAMPEYVNAIMAERPTDSTTSTGLVYLKNGIILEQYSCPLIEEGAVTGRLWSFEDVTEKVLAEERLKMLAATDELTGLWNRRYFLGRAEYEITRATRDGQPLALVYLDIDHFKNINDTHGHAAGDRALEYLASVLTNQLRSTDTVGRIGGEEFAVLFPNTDIQGAFAIADKVRAYFESSSFRFDGRQLSFTVSMGIAELTDSIRGIDALLLAADIACYKAKEKGRNRVEARADSVDGREP